jgi:hypothetical protein
MPKNIPNQLSASCNIVQAAFLVKEKTFYFIASTAALTTSQNLIAQILIISQSSLDLEILTLDIENLDILTD